MQSPPLTVAARIAGWCAVTSIGVLSLLPGSLRPITGWSGLLEHFAAYFLTAICLAYGHKTRVSPVLVGALLTVYAAILEAAQIWVPGRNAGILDVVAGALGCSAGGLLIMVFVPRMPDAGGMSQRP